MAFMLVQYRQSGPERSMFKNQSKSTEPRPTPITSKDRIARMQNKYVRRRSYVQSTDRLLRFGVGGSCPDLAI